MEFLSDEWFSAVASAVSGVRLAGDPSAAFELDAGGLRSHIAIRDGRISELARGPLPTADVGLAWTAQEAVRLAWGTLAGNEAMLATTTFIPSTGEPAGPPAPMGLMDRREVDALPEMVGASLQVQFIHPGGPLGEFGYVQDFVDGHLRGEQLAVLDNADVRVKASYRKMALLRAGTHTLLELIDGCEIAGEMAALASMAAILETEEFEALRTPSAATAAALATMGELRADPEFQAGFGAVMDETLLP